MPIKTQIPDNFGVYFITFTCFRWISLIEMTDGYDLIYNWFDHLKKKTHYIVGYVIMPNHVHALIGFSNVGKSLNKIIGDGKRFMAYEIVERLNGKNKTDVLELLSESVNESDRSRNKHHEIWSDSFDWKECNSWEMMSQKLDYMHNNPCKGKWNLAESPVDYLHSSAKFYITGEQGIYSVTNFMELSDEDLSKEKHL